MDFETREERIYEGRKYRRVNTKTQRHQDTTKAASKSLDCGLLRVLVPLCLCVYSTVLSAFVNPFFACFKIQRITRPLLYT
jgi:hypothetical protein